ncbi:GLUG motif-containing protein [Pseudomonas chlororaphis]|uniref:Filamentous hemagglutinin n=1 Tax=Pseudomonas chlororaphis TaxID=587753 RepID=A0A0D5Y3B9_9PSED|nr:GLUG motif-containing protein [Pseudomonas chlororaphis]AKA25781.1 filamentous hemagglutinin [Pseudomonas chlororaphis]
MNKSYALIWNQATGCWNVASEGTRRRTKSSRHRVVIAAGLSLLGLLAQAPAFALPGGAHTVSGEAAMHIGNDGKQMTIDQQSNKLITQWNDFSIAGDESVIFHQPGKDSIALNRVIGTNGSDIQGRIDANGQVFLINPNGVVFGKSAQVNVGGLVASTQDISDKDFLEGSYRFSGNSGKAVSNAGQITASEGGSVALLGAQVSNSGVIQAQMGSVALAAGKDFSVNFDGNGLLNLQVNAGAVDALAQNGGLLKADGGQVLMTARSASELLKTVVSNQGVIEANTLQNKAGKIVLEGGSNGGVHVAGRLNASAQGVAGNGGVVENRGASVEVAQGTQVNTQADQGTTGTWKISSNEVSVAKAEHSSNAPTLHADTLARNLATTNVELNSDSNLSVNQSVAWNSANTLGLKAKNGDVHINAALNATGSDAALKISASRGISLNDNVALTGTGARLELNSTQGHSLKDGKAVTLSGKGAGFSANGQAYHVVQNLEQLRGIESDMNGRYVLGNQIAGQGRFKTIGDGNSFSGTLDGLGNTLSDLSIYGTSGYVGLFGVNQGQIGNLNLERISASGTSSTHYNTQVGTLAGVNTGSIRNVKAKDVTVTGASHLNALGGLVALNLHGNIDNASVSGKVIGNQYTYVMGGLVGENVSNVDGVAKISNSHVDASLEGQMQDAPYGAGGLVGMNRDGIIDNASSTGLIKLAGSNLSIGGLVGKNTGRIANSRSIVHVAGGSLSRVGGLVGFNDQGSISDSRAAGQVTGNGTEAIGGLVGKNRNGTIANSVASGHVTDQKSRSIGGLIGHNQDSKISNVLATGMVKGGDNANIGGLIGYSDKSSIKNASSTSVLVTGGNGSSIGGLIGHSQDSEIANATASPTVAGGSNSRIGGLVGHSQNNKIANATVSTTVVGGNNSQVGGLVGANEQGSISDSHASGQVTGQGANAIGGLIGRSAYSTISNSSANNTVSDLNSSYVGGLIGHNWGGRLANVSTSGSVKGGSNANIGGLVGFSGDTVIANASTTSLSITGGNNAFVGGLIGFSRNTDIADASVSATVTGGNNSEVGGLVGSLQGRVNNASATGSVKGGDYSKVGGLVGTNGGQISNSRATSNVSGGYAARLGGLVGLNVGNVRLSSAGGKIDYSPLLSQKYGGLIGLNFGSQSLNSVFGEATKVPMIGQF